MSLWRDAFLFKIVRFCLCALSSMWTDINPDEQSVESRYTQYITQCLCYCDHLARYVMYLGLQERIDKY